MIGTDIVTDLNILSHYLAQRDLSNLESQTLNKSGIKAFDLLILFGGCIPAAADLVGHLWQVGTVKKIMIVGGVGHTTDHLRNSFKTKIPVSPTQTEADLFASYLNATFQIPLKDLLIENQSTNCGENVFFALETLVKSGYLPQHTLIMQDSAMQRRMAATFAKIWPKDFTHLIHYSPYLPIFTASTDGLSLRPDLWGMWQVPRFIELLMGEIPRLRDDSTGYGPKGANYLIHLDLPQNVLAAFKRLEQIYPTAIRPAYTKRDLSK